MKHLIILLISITLFAKNISIIDINTHIKDTVYTVSLNYNVGDSDSKVSLRKNSILEAKSIVAEKIGSYIISQNISYSGYSNTIANVNTTKHEVISAIESSAEIVNESYKDNMYYCVVLVYVNNNTRDNLIDSAKKFFEHEAKTFNATIQPISISSSNINTDGIYEDTLRDTIRKKYNNVVVSQDNENSIVVLNDLKQNVNIDIKYNSKEGDEYIFDAYVKINEYAMKQYINEIYIKESCRERNFIDSLTTGVIEVALSPILIPMYIFSEEHNITKIFIERGANTNITVLVPLKDASINHLQEYKCNVDKQINLNISIDEVSIKYPIIYRESYYNNIHFILKVKSNNIKKYISTLSITL